MKRGFTLIELLVVIAIIWITAAILFPVFSHSHRGSSRRASCQSNLKQIGLGFLQYAQDYDERLPIIASHSVASSKAPFATPYGWADAVQPYIKSTQIFQCPSEKTSPEAGTDGVAPGFTDYYFNTNLDRRTQKSSPNAAMTLLCGEGNDGRDGTDARYNRNVIPQAWRDTEDSPARRHLDTANYLFADGHVKAFKPELVKIERATSVDLSFAP